MGNICGAQDRAEEVGIRDGEDGGGGGERQSGRKDPTRRSVLFSNVSLSCRTALSHLEGFGERLARERFRTDLHSHHLDWMHVGYDWLLSKEEIPKNMGERLPVNYFSPASSTDDGGQSSSAVDPVSALGRADALLQRMRLVLELAARDLRTRGGDPDLAEDFLRARDFVKAANFEVSNALDELNGSTRFNVTPDFIPAGVRSDPSALRDWIFYRDSRNSLEFLAEIFDHFVKLEKKSGSRRA